MRSTIFIMMLLFVLASPLYADMYGSGPTPQPRQQPTYRAEAFVDSIGLSAVPSTAFLALGVRHYRTGLRDITQPVAAQPERAQQMADLWAQYGVRPMVLLDALRDPVSECVRLLKLYPPGVVAEIEGPNEVNNKFPPQELNLKYKGITDEAAAAAYMDDFVAAIRADDTTKAIPVVAFTSIFSDYRLAKPHTAFDFSNMHSYQGNDIPSSSLEMNTTRFNNLLPVGGVIKPFVPTECGYNVEEDVSNHTGISGSLQAQAKNIPMLLAEYFRHGIRRTYLFALHNADGYGLLESDNITRRPAYFALQHLIAALRDATWNTRTKQWEGGDFTPRALLFEMPNAPQSIHTLVLQKHNGEYRLLIWNEVPNYDPGAKQEKLIPPTPVTLVFSTPVQSTATLLRQQATGSLETTTTHVNHGVLSLDVDSSVMIVRLMSATPAPASIIPTPSGLQGQASESEIRIQWQPVRGAAGYFLFRNGWHIATTSTTTTYLDQSTWLRPGLGYTYAVQAFSATGVMSAQNTVIIQTAARIPDLAVTALYLDNPTPKPGEKVHLDAKMKNIGAGMTPPRIPVGATWLIDGKVIGWSTPLGPLKPGEEWTLSANDGGADHGQWTATPGTHLLTCVLDDINRLPGENKKNNYADRTIVVGETYAGEILGATQAAPGGVDVTHEGTLDWIHWGLDGKNNINRKAGANLFGVPLVKFGAGYCDATSGCPVAISWRDGAPTAHATNTYAGLWWNVVGTAQSFTAPADTTTRVVRIYVAGIEGAGGTLSATLSDHAAPPYISSTWDGNAGNGAWAAVPDGFSAVYTIRYRAASAGQQLTITWKLTSEPNRFLGQARLQAATLALPGN